MFSEGRERVHWEEMDKTSIWLLESLSNLLEAPMIDAAFAFYLTETTKRVMQWFV